MVIAGRARIAVLSKERCKAGPAVLVPGLEQFHIATALTRTMAFVGELRLPSGVRPAGSSFELEPLT